MLIKYLIYFMVQAACKRCEAMLAVTLVTPCYHVMAIGINAGRCRARFAGRFAQSKTWD
jgi:hypothetical protein